MYRDNKVWNGILFRIRVNLARLIAHVIDVVGPFKSLTDYKSAFHQFNGLTIRLICM